MSDNNGKGEVGLGYTNKIANRIADSLIDKGLVLESQRDIAVQWIEIMLPMPMAEAERMMEATLADTPLKPTGPSLLKLLREALSLPDDTSIRLTLGCAIDAAKERGARSA